MARLVYTYAPSARQQRKLNALNAGSRKIRYTYQLSGRQQSVLKYLNTRNVSKNAKYYSGYWRAKANVHAMSKMSPFTPRQIGVGAAAAGLAVTGGVIGYKVGKRVARRRSQAAHHGYRNKPPQLSKAQRQQMARRRRRVRGRFA